MAGIGFSLKRLFDKKGIFNICRAYGYASIITTGPMLLGVAMLLAVSFAAKLGGMDGHDRELLNCMITYSLIASLTVTTWLNMGVTRFVSDMLYEDKHEKIMPAFYGSTIIKLVLALMTYGVFLLFSGVRPIYMALCMWFSLVLIVTWNQTIFLTAIKDYQSLVLSFCISLMMGFVLILIFVLIGWVCIESFLLGMIFAYGILMCWYHVVLLNYFPEKKGSNFSFLRSFSQYTSLIISGGVLNIGLFAHLIIMYFGPLAVQVEGLFYGAPQYDVPALCAYFCLLVTTVTFVTSVEVKFYPKYSTYYGLFNDKGSIKDIKEAEKEMLSVLQSELTFSGHRQVFTTILFIVVGSAILDVLPSGFSQRSITIFRFLCVGYGTYAIANSNMLILLYFENYIGTLISSVAFGVLSSGLTIWQILYGRQEFYGMGFVVGALVFYFITVIELDRYTKNLPYHLLSRQFVVPEDIKGVFASIARALDRRQNRIEEKKQIKKEKKAEKFAQKEGIYAR